MLALRFPLELAALAAFATDGLHAVRGPARFALAAALVLAAAAVWGRWIAPASRRRLADPARLGSRGRQDRPGQGGSHLRRRRDPRSAGPPARRACARTLPRQRRAAAGGTPRAADRRRAGDQDPLTGRVGPQIMPSGLNSDTPQALRSLAALDGIPADVLLPGHGEPWTEGAAEAVRLARAAGPS
jgi:hypothetical protein